MKRAQDEKESIFTKITNIHITLIGVLLLSFSAFFIGVTIFFIISALEEIGAIIVVKTVLLLVYLIPLRPFRKRLTFMRKLKKLCSENKLELEQKRGFFQGFKLNTEGFDLTVNSRKVIYCVRFFTPSRRASHIVILDDNTVEIRTNIHKNRFKIVLGTDKTKIRKIAYSYNDTLTSNTRRVENILLVNPVPHDMFKVGTDGVEVPVGIGERIFDYKLYNASGFLDMIERE